MEIIYDIRNRQVMPGDTIVGTAPPFDHSTIFKNGVDELIYEVDGKTFKLAEERGGYYILNPDLHDGRLIKPGPVYY